MECIKYRPGYSQQLSHGNMATHLQIINFYMRSSIYILYSLISLIKLLYNFFYVLISFSSMLHFLLSDEQWKLSTLCDTLNSLSHFCCFYYFSFSFFNCLLHINSVVTLSEPVIVWCGAQYANSFTVLSTFTTLTRYHNYSHQTRLRPSCKVWVKFSLALTPIRSLKVGISLFQVFGVDLLPFSHNEWSALTYPDQLRRACTRTWIFCKWPPDKT